MLRQLAPLVLAAALGAGCSLGSTYACGVDADCLDGNRSGVCEADSVCSFPDASCPGGQRYGDHSGARSGECIGGQDTTGNPAAETDRPATDSGASVGSLDGSSGSAEVTTASLDDGETTTSATTSDTTSVASAGTEVGSSSGGTGTDPFYEPCGSECPRGNCFIHFSMEYAVCATSCEPECSPFEDAFGTAYPTECGTLGHCMILCSGTDMCPAGSTCLETFGPTAACLFPYG